MPIKVVFSKRFVKILGAFYFNGIGYAVFKAYIFVVHGFCLKIVFHSVTQCFPVGVVQDGRKAFSVKNRISTMYHSIQIPLLFNNVSRLIMILCGGYINFDKKYLRGGARFCFFEKNDVAIVSHLK